MWKVSQRGRVLHPAPLLTAALLAGVAVLPASAHAGEGESAVSVGLGYATYIVPFGPDESVSPTAGGILAVEYEYAFAEAFSVRLEAAGAFYAGGGLAYHALLDAGLVYRFDVLKYVPYGFAGLGASYGSGGPLSGQLDDDGIRDCDPADAGCGGGLEPVLQIGLGLDVLRDRTSSWGVEARVASLLGDTTLFTVGLRGTWRWGFF